tara:strand:- start:1413 stop:2516 length:1104 start_codon:yes stop_codon:yes gene_type:complete
MNQHQYARLIKNPFKARSLIFVRHGERMDKVNYEWTSGALRPHDTPLSTLGKSQATSLGKWLYGKLNIHQPLTIFSSPFIRCIQTAHHIAKELDGLKLKNSDYTDIHDSFSTQICVEPGICEDPYYMKGLNCNTPWFLNPSDLMSISDRINLSYKPIRQVNYEKIYNKEKHDVPTYTEISGHGTNERLNSIAHELAMYPSINNGVGIVVTHAKPFVDMIKSMNKAPGGILLPSYDEIKEGHFDGPPLQYTACTHMNYNKDMNMWLLDDNSKLFSNEHDPALKMARKNKKKRVTRYVLDNKLIENNIFTSSIFKHFQLDRHVLYNKKAGDTFKIHNIVAHDSHKHKHEIEITLPQEYISGDTIIIRTI